MSGTANSSAPNASTGVTKLKGYFFLARAARAAK